MADVGDVELVLRRYFPFAIQECRVEAIGAGGGWSGSKLWRIIDGQGRQFCLRRWPWEHPGPERLRLIHRVVCRVAADLPIVARPLPAASGETFVRHGGHLWQLETWRPGRADFHQHPSRQRLRAAMHALARFHQFAAACDSRRGPAPAIWDRTQEIELLQCGRQSEIERSLDRSVHWEIDARAPRLFELACAALRVCRAWPDIDATAALPLQPAIRDIHYDHVLFTGEEVTGLVDFGALRIDTPLADVARLVGSLAGDDQPARRFALDAYARLRPLSEIDRRLIDWLDQSSQPLAAFHWLTWLYLDCRDMGEIAPIVQRLDAIARRLENFQAPGPSN